MSCLAKLYFGWSAYFSERWPTPTLPETVKALYEADGLKLLSAYANQEKVTMVLEAKGGHPPQWIAGRLKGRLNHYLKREPLNFPGFDRSFHLQSLGQNDRKIVSAYVQSQVDASDLVDPLYRQRMNELRFHEEGKSKVSTSHRGRYDLVLHVVLVIANRHRIFSEEARKVFGSLVGACDELGACAFDISMMPDHAHLMLGWPPEMSAMEVIEGLKRESGKILRRPAYWNDGGYVGTVGPYRLSVALGRNRQLGGW